MLEIFQNALCSKNLEGRPPVWFMRQAGRYMKAYRKMREQFSFLELCTNPELIYEVTKLPLDAFEFDAAIVFSDILLILQALGFSLRYEDGKGPLIDDPLTGPQDISRLFGKSVVEK